MKLNIGDRVIFIKDDTLYEGIIQSIDGNKIEIDDSSIMVMG